MKFQPIQFSELKFNIANKTITDGNSMVMIEVSLPTLHKEMEELCNEITEDFKSTGFLRSGKVIDIRPIKGNVKEHTGDYRQDSLLILSDYCKVDPIKRIQAYQFIKWTSDFITNYKSDYKS